MDINHSCFADRGESMAIQMTETIRQPTVKETIAFMIAFHGDQKDKSGVPYFYHPARVMIRLGPDATDNERIAALLHDVIEDTETTFDDLEGLGYSEEVLKIVNLLTKRDAETHKSYIFRIVGSGNTSAMKIKLADMYDNSNLARAEACADSEVRETILSMINSRYRPAIRFVRESLATLGEDTSSIISDDVDVQFDFGENND